MRKHTTLERIFLSALCTCFLLISGGCKSDVNEEYTGSDESIFHIEDTSQEAITQEAILQGTAGSQAVTAPEKDEYSGVYVDRQGTEDSIFSELEISCREDGLYDVFISFYRLGVSEGTAEAEGDRLLFEDQDNMMIKGEIRIEETGAVLTITESGFTYIEPGEVMEFPEKLSSD